MSAFTNLLGTEVRKIYPAPPIVGGLDLAAASPCEASVVVKGTIVGVGYSQYEWSLLVKVGDRLEKWWLENAVTIA